MKKRQSGKRYLLLLYWRSMERLWKPTLLLGLLFATLWWLSQTSRVLPFQANAQRWLLMGAAVLLAFSLFAFLARKMAYVQVKADHLVIVTPFLRLKISYRRLRSAHPASMQAIFPPARSNWAQRRYLEPFYSMTVVVLELTGFPLSPGFLRLFLPSEMFSRQSKAMILIVPDWMELSMELDSFYGAWRQTQKRRSAATLSSHRTASNRGR